MGESNLVVKFNRAIADPSRVRHYIESNLRMNRYYVRNRKFGHLLGGFTGGVTGWNVYIELLKKLLPEDEILLNIHNNRLLLDLSDPGISRDLIMYKTREHYSTKRFRSELVSLKESVNEPITVLELGANVGYYALQEADLLGDAADIHAFEPSPSNFERLRTNIRLNDYGDAITAQNMAVGNTPSDLHLRISTQSNQHRIVDEPSEDTVTIPGTTAETYLRKQDIDYGRVNVIRMDVQGFETEIYKGMKSIVNEAEDLLLFIEFHSSLDEDGLSEMINHLEDNDIEIISALTASGVQTWYEYESDVRSLHDLHNISDSVEMILKKQ